MVTGPSASLLLCSALGGSTLALPTGTATSSAAAAAFVPPPSAAAISTSARSHHLDMYSADAVSLRLRTPHKTKHKHHNHGPPPLTYTRFVCCLRPTALGVTSALSSLRDGCIDGDKAVPTLDLHVVDPTAAASEGESEPSYRSSSNNRRSFLLRTVGGYASVTALAQMSFSRPALAEAEPSRSTSDAKITDRIYVDLKGIPSSETDDPSSSSTSTQTSDRIVIGLFGNDSPQPVSILKQLVSKTGLPAECKPKETRTLQREQLESNKVYNSCVENESRGVTYDLSTVWRIDKDRRIDLGAVSGKFVSRVSPTFEDDGGLRHDTAGVVSVRRGNDGGFGFTIYPGSGRDDAATILDEDNIVVGRVLEGMDVVRRLNEIPVVQSSAVNYMALTGGAKGKTAPSRACRYGGAMYCNELKPLKKIQISETGLL